MFEFFNFIVKHWFTHSSQSYYTLLKRLQNPSHIFFCSISRFTSTHTHPQISTLRKKTKKKSSQRAKGCADSAAAAPLFVFAQLNKRRCYSSGWAQPQPYIVSHPSKASSRMFICDAAHIHPFIELVRRGTGRVVGGG